MINRKIPSPFFGHPQFKTFPPTFSCAFPRVFLPVVFTVKRFTGQASLAPISCGGLEIRVRAGHVEEGANMWHIHGLSDGGGCPCRAEVRG